LAVPHITLSAVGKRAFSVSGATVWNKTGVLGFRRYSVEQFSASRHISAVTRDFQTAPQVVLVLSVLFGHSYLTHRAFIFVDLEIISII